MFKNNSPVPSRPTATHRSPLNAAAPLPTESPRSNNSTKILPCPSQQRTPITPSSPHLLCREP